MSALFDDAERFDSLIVVGDTVRRVKDATEDHVGPGTYTPSMANSKDFGHIGVSTSRRSNMDPPISPRSTEHERYATGSVVRDGVWFHTSPLAAVGPGPGEYSPPVISSEHERGRTAKPSSGTVGRQAWDLRGNAGGAPLSNFREGFTVSSSMGTTPRLPEWPQVTLRSGVILLRGRNDGHRTNGIGPGEYYGISNRQDSTTKRSYNVRAQQSQLSRERSLSFSGTSSTAKAFLSLAASTSSRLTSGRQNGAADGRPDLHLLGRRTNSGAVGAGVGVRGGGRRCMSPASAMLTSMRARACPDRDRATRPGPGFEGARSSRSLSPKRNRSRSTSPIRGAGGGRYDSGNATGGTTGGARAAFLLSHVGETAGFQYPQTTPPHQQQRNHLTVGDGVSNRSRGCRSPSPRGGGPARGRKSAPSSPRAAGATAALGSPRRQRAGPACTSAPTSPFRGRSHRKYVADDPSGRQSSGVGGGITGARGRDAPYTFDYFGLAGRRGVWRGLETVAAARAEIGIETPANVDQPPTTAGDGGNKHGAKDDCADDRAGQERGQVSVAGGGAPGSLTPEGRPPNGVCSPTQETRNNLHTYFEAIDRRMDARGSTTGSNLPAPPSPRALRPGSV